MKRCSRCDKRKPWSEFYVRRDGRGDGHSYWCKPCSIEAAQKSAARRPSSERRTYNQRRWTRLRNDPGIVASNRARAAAWAKANPDARRMHDSVRRARKRGAYVEHVEPLVVLERADGVCGICGEDVDPFAFHVDHVIPIARGGAHSYVNTQPAHPACNLAKGAR